MGLGGGLVKRVFNKSRSLSRQCNERSHGVEKSKWASVRTYLCGDELESLDKEDSDSVRSTEATVGQPVAETSIGEESFTVENEDNREAIAAEAEDRLSNLLMRKENAAIFIQSAFRGFRALRKYKEMRHAASSTMQTQTESTCEEIEAASTEVQIGGSVENLIIREGGINNQPRILHKSRSQGYQIKVEWDDSTVSSNVLKLRIQNRHEAMTRRERALAYAFSQQLRTCSSKKKLAQCDSTESNIGWSWLERWMATRMPDNSLADDCLSKHVDTKVSERRNTIVLRKRFDIAAEEKESCGSNDVSVNLDSFRGSDCSVRDCYEPNKNRLKDVTNVSRRKTVPDCQYSPHTNKVSNRFSRIESEKGKRQKQALSMSNTETKLDLSTK